LTGRLQSYGAIVDNVVTNVYMRSLATIGYEMKKALADRKSDNNNTKKKKKKTTRTTAFVALGDPFPGLNITAKYIHRHT